LNSRIREYANYSVRGIKKLITKTGPRPCGSEAEKQAQEYVFNELKTATDDVIMEEFTVHPRAFFGWFRIDAVCLLATIVLLNLGLAYFAIPLLIISIAALVGEFLLYKEFLDPLYPKKTSYNTFATIRPTGEVKRHIIFGGHVDSSYEWSPTYYGKAPLMYFCFIYPAVGLGLAVVSTIVACATGQGFSFMEISGANMILARIMIAFIPAYFILFFFINYKRPVDGANDNLTGVFTSIAILKFMKDNNITFENTQVSCLSTGGEEAGLRGAKAFAKAHKDKLLDPNVETVFIAVDTLRDYDTMAIYRRDLSGLVCHDIRACELLKEAGKEAGIDMEYSVIFAGASDACAMTQAGVTGCCFAAMDPGPPHYYHTRLDTYDNMDFKSVEKGFEIMVNTLFLFDEKGLG
jgi:hypothetical protein